MNICQAIDCPYYRSGANSGCQRYLVALHCHLLHPSAGVTTEGFQMNNQYALYSDSVDVAEQKVLNEEFLKKDESYQQQVEVQQRFGSDVAPYPNRIL